MDGFDFTDYAVRGDEKQPVVTSRGTPSPPFGDSRRGSMDSSRYPRPTTADTKGRSVITTTTTGRRKKPSQYKSYRLVGEYSRPWLADKRMKRSRWNNLIICAIAVAGVLLAAFWAFWAYRKVPQHKYCLVMEESFTGGSIDDSVWTHEVQVGGYGNGAFDWTTSDSSNSYIDGQGLHIVPTLTNESTSIDNDLIYQGYTLNLTADGTCTGTTNASCVVVSNHTTGIIIPPVRSARLSTKGKKTIRYGRVEVVAKMPRGDWLWPAIWMMPEDSVYGDWPRSGEIDIMESRGNADTYRTGGRNSVASTLHYGPASTIDGFYRSTAKMKLLRGDLTQKFHTYGLEWSENYLYVYLDTRLIDVLYLTFPAGSSLWNSAGFGNWIANNSHVDNPWVSSPNPNAPFDQSFYLIMNVAVGGTNGWFPDNEAGKPWVDISGEKAIYDFWTAIDSWYPTWPKNADRGMTVQSVKMWQQGACA